MDWRVCRFCARKDEVHLCATRAICRIADEEHASHGIP
jgi:hypothetical protein